MKFMSKVLSYKGTVVKDVSRTHLFHAFKLSCRLYCVSVHASVPLLSCCFLHSTVRLEINKFHILRYHASLLFVNAVSLQHGKSN